MERQEPTFGSDLKDVEFRPRAYRGPSRPQTRSVDASLSWKIAVGVGVGVFAALLLFNAYERYQARRDAEVALKVMQAELTKLERQLANSAPVIRPQPQPRRTTVAVKPVPPGYRCVGRTLLRREGNNWTQITARSNHIYCPPGGTVKDCYQVTPSSVGCR